MHITRETTSVKVLVEEATRAFAAHAARRGITITSKAPEATVELDRVRVRQALDNLLDNAIRHARTTVSVRATIGRDCVTLEVSDDGPGFDTHAKDDAFEPFAAGGLGLSIVQQIARAHGGRAYVESNDCGARVALVVSNVAASPRASLLHGLPGRDRRAGRKSRR
jgi:signal transduction histidine kinase